MLRRLRISLIPNLFRRTVREEKIYSLQSKASVIRKRPELGLITNMYSQEHGKNTKSAVKVISLYITLARMSCNLLLKHVIYFKAKGRLGAFIPRCIGFTPLSVPLKYDVIRIQGGGGFLFYSLNYIL